ncbi:hypothetical protein V1511DRAFT_501465 [Dipodascopsis uninucleata]
MTVEIYPGKQHADSVLYDLPTSVNKLAWSTSGLTLVLAQQQVISLLRAVPRSDISEPSALNAFATVTVGQPTLALFALAANSKPDANVDLDSDLWVVSCHADCSVRAHHLINDTIDQESIIVLAGTSGHTELVNAVCATMNEEGELEIASTGDDRSLILYCKSGGARAFNLSSPGTHVIYEHHTEPSGQLATRVVVMEYAGRVRILDPSTGAWLITVYPDPHLRIPIQSMSIIPETHTLVTTGANEWLTFTSVFVKRATEEVSLRGGSGFTFATNKGSFYSIGVEIARNIVVADGSVVARVTVSTDSNLFVSLMHTAEGGSPLLVTTLSVPTTDIHAVAVSDRTRTIAISYGCELMLLAPMAKLGEGTNGEIPLNGADQLDTPQEDIKMIGY